MFKKAIRFDTSATGTPGSTTEYYGLLRSTTVTAGLNPYSSGMLIRECVTQAWPRGKPVKDIRFCDGQQVTEFILKMKKKSDKTQRQWNGLHWIHNGLHWIHEHSMSLEMLKAAAAYGEIS